MEEDTPEVVPQDSPEDARPALSNEELQAALLESQRREREANERAEKERQRLDSLIRGNPQPVRRDEPSPEQKLGDMPDPAVDPAAFARWLEQRDAQRERKLSSELEQRDAAISQRQAASDLWNRFVAKYPDYAALRKLAQVAFSDVIGRYGNSIPADPSQVEDLMDDVKRAMDDMRGTAAQKPTPRPNRTGGVEGGSPAPKPPRKQEPASEPTVTLIDDILDWQMEHGYI